MVIAHVNGRPGDGDLQLAHDLSDGGVAPTFVRAWARPATTHGAPAAPEVGDAAIAEPVSTEVCSGTVMGQAGGPGKLFRVVRGLTRMTTSFLSRKKTVIRRKVDIIESQVSQRTPSGARERMAMNFIKSTFESIERRGEALDERYNISKNCSQVPASLPPQPCAGPCGRELSSRRRQQAAAGLGRSTQQQQQQQHAPRRCDAPA